MSEKVRKIDYKKEEFKALTGLKDDAFEVSLKKVEARFNLNPNKFRIDQDEKSDYFFSFDIAALLSLLIKVEKEYPMFRKNSKFENVDFSKVNTYYKKLFNEIENLPYEIRELIESFPSYRESLKTYNYIEELVNQLVIFINNISSNIKHSGMGTTIEFLTKELVRLNYILFEKEYANSSATKSQVTKESSNNDLYEVEKTEIVLQRENLPVDHLIANLIKIIINDTHYLNGANKISPTFNYNNINKQEQLILGVNVESLKEASEAELHKSENVIAFERDMYLTNFTYYVDKLERDLAKKNISQDQKDFARFKQKMQRLSDGENIFSFQEEADREEVKRILQSRIQHLNEQLLILDDENRFEKNKDTAKQIINEYNEFCSNILESSNSHIEKAVEDFVGKAIFNLNYSVDQKK